MQGAERISLSIHSRQSNIDVKQHRLTDPFNLRDDTFEVERLREHDFEYLLHVDRCGCRAKDERCVHCFGKSLRLLRDLLLFVARECRKGIKLGADKKWYRGLHFVFRVSFNNPCHVRKKFTLLNPRACRYHSFTELRVDLRDRSNMNKMATASLQTSGSMFTNSRCPPRSQMENVIVVRRTEIVFSIKLTPGGQMPQINTMDTRA